MLAYTKTENAELASRQDRVCDFGGWSKGGRPGGHATGSDRARHHARLRGGGLDRRLEWRLARPPAGPGMGEEAGGGLAPGDPAHARHGLVAGRPEHGAAAALAFLRGPAA